MCVCVCILFFLHLSSLYGLSLVCILSHGGCEVVAEPPNGFDKHRHKLLRLPHTVAITVQVKV